MLTNAPSSVSSPFGRTATFPQGKAFGKSTYFSLIRLFSLRSKIHPLRHSRIGARLKKPSRLAFSCASRPTGGEKAFGSALPSNAPRKRWLLPWVEKLSASPQGADD